MANVLKDILRTLRGSEGTPGLVTTSPSFKTPRKSVPGIGTGAPYTTAYAFGTKFQIAVPQQGVISNVVFLDYNNSGIAKELVLFDGDFVQTADNAVFAPSAIDLTRCQGVVAITSYYAYSGLQVGIATPALWYSTPSGSLWGQFVTRGADNISAGKIPDFFLVVAT